MATKKLTGITATMIKFGGAISAARALPKAKGKRPAVIILHERYGIDQHTKDLTAKLAQAGLVGLAPDLFHRFTGDRKALLRGEQRVDLTDDGALADLNAAVDYLKRLKEVDATRIAIIGVCQTGRQPLLLAAMVGPVALLAFAAFYASPVCEDKLVWDRRAFWPLALSGIFETLAVLFMLVVRQRMIVTR